MKVKVVIPVAINEKGQYYALGWGDPQERLKDGMEEDFPDMESQAVESLYESYTADGGFDQCRVIHLEVEVDIPEVMKVRGTVGKVREVKDEDEKE